MKIPNTPPGGAPYYAPPINGMDINPPWQANGVMVEGIPSNSNGSYTMPQQHNPMVPQMHPHAVPNSVSGSMSQSGGNYYPPSEPEECSITPPENQDFSEYMWMENQDEFDKEVMQKLEEEALMEQCIEDMLADEIEAMGRTSDISLEEQVSKSKLNPLAAEFVPSFISALVPTGDAVQSSTVVANVQVTTEPPTDALSELTISKTSPLVDKSSPDSTSEAEKDKENENIVVVSAKDVLTPKSSIDDTDSKPIKTNRERKDSDKKKGDGKRKGSTDNLKKEKAVVATVAAVTTAAVVASKGSTKTNSLRARTQSGGDENKKSDEVKKQAGGKRSAEKETVQSKKQEVKVDDVVDLQGPPLPAVSVPVVSALAANPEPEKPSTPAPPAVFNYAAAAKANLPAKPAQPQPAAAVPPKETTPTPSARPASTPVTTGTTAAKPQTNPSTKTNTQAAKPKSLKPGDKSGESSKKPAPAKSGTANSVKKGGKK